MKIGVVYGSIHVYACISDAIAGIAQSDSSSEGTMGMCTFV